MEKSNLFFYALLILFAISSGSGCATPKPMKTSYVLRGDLVSCGYRIADQLIMNLNQEINRTDSIIVATFADVNNLEKSSTFGRIIAEQISSRLSQRGYKVSEIKFRKNSVFMQKEKGEFLLSREMRNVSKKYKASALVVGTYGEAFNAIYLSARIITPTNSLIISSCDFALQLGARSQAILSRSN